MRQTCIKLIQMCGVSLCFSTEKDNNHFTNINH